VCCYDVIRIEQSNSQQKQKQKQKTNCSSATRLLDGASSFFFGDDLAEQKQQHQRHHQQHQHQHQPAIASASGNRSADGLAADSAAGKDDGDDQAGTEEGERSHNHGHDDRAHGDRGYYHSDMPCMVLETEGRVRWHQFRVRIVRQQGGLARDPATGRTVRLPASEMAVVERVDLWHR
jgi:hypothetical protein